MMTNLFGHFALNLPNINSTGGGVSDVVAVINHFGREFFVKVRIRGWIQRGP